ncbi:MAG: NADH-quinone oxidoreductase subunit L [Bacteroidia bacterium]|nr:NADH-quinone oxidoreductase subunit L [Bacteroidia bacterium]
MNNVTMLATIVLILPLLIFTVLILFGKKLPRQGDWLAVGLMGIATLLSIPVFIQTWGKEVSHFRFTWIDLGSAGLPIKLTMGILVDDIAALMVVLVTFICFLVLLFSMEYMHAELEDKKLGQYARYYAYMGIFTFAMLGIVLADNLLAMYISWEIVGLGSYLLIGYWYYREAPSEANKKAFIINRIGDVGMFIGILIMWYQFRTLDFEAIKELMQNSKIVNGEWVVTIVKGEQTITHSLDVAWLTAGGLLLFCGAIGKSAQFPLHVWLPDAMEGPTTASSIIHAATMVAAGVYLTGRIFPILNVDALTVIAFIGAFTSFLAASIALTQTDLKRVLAYSTVSQLGYMIMGMGVGSYDASLFHLVTHAFFKCGLFLSAASVIHAMHHVEHELHHHHRHVHFDPQDMRYMGGLRKKMPFTFVAYTIMMFALAGLPFFSGFLSKDAILAGAWGWAKHEGGIAFIVPLLGFVTAFMTAFYMGRQWFLTFFGEFRLEKIIKDAKGAFEMVHESPILMKIPLAVLAFMSIWFVYSWNPIDGEIGWMMQRVTIPASIAPGSYGDRDKMDKEALKYFAEKHHIEYKEATQKNAADHKHEKHHNDEHQVEGEIAHYAHVSIRQAEIMAERHHKHYPAVGISIVLAFAGLGLAYLAFKPEKVAQMDMFAEKDPITNFSYRKWYFDELYHATFVRLYLILTAIQTWIDKWLVDGLVNLAGYLTTWLGAKIRSYQTGRVQNYLVYMAMVIILLMFFVAYHVS